ncbi:trehalose-6-phosphate synthase [Actinomadura sp. DC4]|uniref:trehalose-6-phosphate synthase n=1 Tax=Actinomadura sp. DC4 TaxID=3055069 RepID=UPI0025B23127|nr:trehalose-6-phosphate synthase [Actinomadura sp. DC4]MDN3354205.1 trehalose-6-phosphate synthase [Actinomadura sp. DC4]
MKLVICSNSAPRWQEGVGLMPRSPGGLVPLLVTLLGEHGGDWICTAPGGAPPGSEAVEVTTLPDGVTLHQVRQSKAVLEQHYTEIGIRLMLWLFHYLFDTAREPLFDRKFADAWTGYETVNRAYADRLAKLMTNAPDELVLINDYHLFLVPEMLGARAGGRLAFFHGLPWCDPDYFGLLPARIRDRILTSLLRCDIVGFHSTRWAEAFLACCARFLPGCSASDGRVVFEGHETRVSVAPFPLDVDAVDRLRGSSDTALWEKHLQGLGEGRRMIARADRIDLWKNLPRGFAAYESVLERKPGLADEWWFCAVATPPSRTTERSRDLQRKCEKMVARINERFGLPTRPAVSLVYPDLATTRNCVVAALSSADLTLVNPTLDGMNLVAKEALYLGEHAPLLLSVNAGAYEELAGHVTPIEPFDVESTAQALLDGMNGGGVSAAQAAGRDLLRGQTAAGWLAKLTAS